MTEDHAEHGMWRELRSWPVGIQLGVAAFAAVAVVLAVTIAVLTAGPDYPADADRPGGDLGLAGDRITIEPTAAPDEPEATAEPRTGASPYTGDPLWTEQVADPHDEAVRVDQGLLVLGEERLRLQDEDGMVWEHAVDGHYAEVGLAGDLVIVAEDIEDDDSWPGLRETVALDLDTGEPVWTDRDASFVTVFADTVFMTECTGEQDDRIGDCTLYARDPADRSEQWSAPTYASAQVASASPWTGANAPDRVMVAAYPTGHADRTVTVFERGADLLSVRTRFTPVLDGDLVIVADDYDDNPADECTARVSAYRLGRAEPLWQIEADTRKSDDLANCGNLPTDEPVDGRMPLTVDGEAVVVDAATGETVWTAPEPGQAVALGRGGDVLIAAAWEAGEDNLVAHDTATGDELWRATVECCHGATPWTAGRTLWLHSGLAVDLDTGDAAELPGAVQYRLPGQVVTVTGEDPPTLRAWPADLWD